MLCERAAVRMIASQLGAATIAADWQGVDAVLPIIEAMRKEGAVVLLKFDGARVDSEAGPYTVLVSGGPLGDEFFRVDCQVLEDGLAKVITSYARRCWGYSDPS